MRYNWLTLGALLAMAIVLAGDGVLDIAWAGPPLVTDDPETPGKHGWEVNISHNIEKVRDEFLMAVPLFDFNYGVRDNDQLKIEFPILSVDPTDERNRWGVGDLLIGYKYRFLDEDRAGWQLSAYPQLLIPTGDDKRGLGDGRTILQIPAQIGKHFLDERLFVYAEFGYHLVFDDSDFNSWEYGIAAAWQVTKKFVVMAEIHGAFFPRCPGNGGQLTVAEHEEADDVFFNIGMKCSINDNIAFIGSAGRSFQDSIRGTPELLTFVGLQITWGGGENNDNSANGNGNHYNNREQSRP